jgi:hypothetical protein
VTTRIAGCQALDESRRWWDGGGSKVVAHGVDGEVGQDEHEVDHQGSGDGKDVLEEPNDGGVCLNLHARQHIVAEQCHIVHLSKCEAL